MAKSIKSFNANDDVLKVITDEKINNFSKWANEMILKGYAASKQTPIKPKVVIRV